MFQTREFFEMAASTWAAASTACGTVRLQGCMSLPQQVSLSSRASFGLRISPAQAQCIRSLDRRLCGVTKAQVATTEAAVSESPKLVDAPVSIVTGASRGIGKAIALALGGAGGKVCRLAVFDLSP